MARITISLMQEFDKLTNDIIVIGATNRKDRIDEALLRRFSLKHEVKVLDSDEKVAMIHKFIDNVGIEFSNDEVAELAECGENQSVILNELIRRISVKIADSIE